MAKIIDGKLISSKIKEKVKLDVEELKSKGINPALAVILVGQDPASMVYVNNKEKTCNALGIESKVYRLDETTTTEELLDLIDKLNKDNNIHGILLQHPVPSHIDEKLAFNTILPEKDVDGFNNINVGKLSNNEKDAFVPCTPLGVLEMLKHEGII
jgi:methylenetetrahydrofolate dehydrogenase (NADP+)/methenyltetrahydrofolate cyclohydrolase